jgi:CBS domain containing-hemolysin-like protein
MPDTDGHGRSAEPASTPSEPRNLPVPVPPAIDPEREGLFARLARALFGWKSGPTRADIEVVLEAAVPGETGVTPEERTMLKNILALRGRRIEDVMVPRADIVAVQQDIPLGELLKVFKGAEHSRLVVYDDTLEDPTGMVHIRDLIGFMIVRAEVSGEKLGKRKKPFPAGLDLKAVDLALPLSSAKITRELLFVPPSMPALDLLAQMQATRIHLALVVDEYGGTDGLVSMEDIVEQIVGDIADEHDDDAPPAVVRQPDGSFVADARASLDDVIAAIGPAFDVGDAAKAVDTLAGYMMTQGGRLPLRGELVSGPAGFEIEVLDADPRRIKKVRIHRRKDIPIERDREGRRRYSGPDAASPTIAPAPPVEAGGEPADDAPSAPSAEVAPPKAPRQP